ncbi:MAG: SDR family oxidoreductase [Puniceicoccales bacterium]|jgi:short-subunit dehydrogenase|nr:SDR family oxidoreductase [Puniceicoccales bacterium]
MKTLSNKTIFITGATSGIGRALAIRLAQAGANLAVCGRSKDKMISLLSELKSSAAGKVFGQAFDSTDTPAVRRFVTEASEVIDTPSVLINNAGANLGKATVEKLNVDDFDAMFALNCRSQLVFTQATHPLMVAAGEGHVINVVSTVALFAGEALAGYTASKAAFDAWTKIYRKEARLQNIRVTAVYPGGTDTPFRTNTRPDYMRPETVAEAIYQIIIMPSDATVHELVMRPQVETNF